MRIRAAVLEEFGAPLAVQDVELAGPGPGEVLVRLLACGVCHTDLYTASGADPSGYAPCVLGHEGCGTVEAVGDGVTSVAPGDRVVTLFSPQCGECVHCRSARRPTSAWRSASSRTRATCPTARAALPRRRADPPLHGHLDVRRGDRDARDRAREDLARRRARDGVPVRVRALDRARRGDVHREGRGRARRASSSARGSSASARSPARGCRAPSGSSASTSPRTGSSSPAGRARPT